MPIVIIAEQLENCSSPVAASTTRRTIMIMTISNSGDDGDDDDDDGDDGGDDGDDDDDDDDDDDGDGVCCGDGGR